MRDIKDEYRLHLPTYLKIPSKDRNIATIESEQLYDSESQLIEIDKDIAKYLSKNELFILTVTNRGFGKRTSIFNYRITNRGGVGITNILLHPLKTGNVVGSIIANSGDDIILITNKATVIRISADDIRISGRNTIGVKLINVSNDEEVVSLTKIATSE